MHIIHNTGAVTTASVFFYLNEHKDCLKGECNMAKIETKSFIPYSVALGTMVGWMVTILSAVIGASLIHGEMIQQESSGFVAMIALFLGSVTSTLTVAVKMPEKRLLMCLLGGSTYYLSLICCALLLFDGLKGGFAPSAAIVISGLFLAYVTGTKRGRKSKYKIPKSPRK